MPMSFSIENIIEVLAGLIDSTDPFDLCENINHDFLSVSNDSRTSGPESVFVAINGLENDGHDFINDAINNGVKLVVHQKSIENQDEVISIKVNDSYAAYARIAELASNFPAHDMQLIAITGTNGKTTTAYLLRSILQQAGKKCGLITTIEYAYPEHSIPAERTTPDALAFQQLLCEFRNAGCEYVVMETSSHALDQNRIGSAKFATAVFTNLTGDHLDYHHDMETYFHAKKLLFDHHLAKKAIACVNIDDAYGKRLARELTTEVSTFGRAGDIRIAEIKTSYSGTDLKLEINGNHLQISSPLFGDFNAYNITGAVAAAISLGLSMDIIVEGLSKMNSVPGRMEGFRLSNGALVIVDYAHTDDALANVLQSLQKINNGGTLIAVFGCGGDRDKTKRPRMGAVAAKFADKIVITSDNPRTENPLSIIQDIVAGIPKNSHFTEIPDRKTAIQQTLASAGKNDIILIAGKGHETYQEIRGVKNLFDDREIIKKYIQDNQSFKA